MTKSYIVPVKISFEQKDNVEFLKDVKINENLESLCAEDDKMAEWMSREETNSFSYSDNYLEQELRDYVSINKIDAQYYCIDEDVIAF